jgi:hypothetical protein
MTRIVDGVLLLEDEEPQQCDLCHKIAELRPYGPNGECICYECGESTPEMRAAKYRAMEERFASCNLTVWNITDRPPPRGGPSVF